MLSEPSISTCIFKSTQCWFMFFQTHTSTVICWLFFLSKEAQIQHQVSSCGLQAIKKNWKTLWIVAAKKMMPIPPANLSSDLSLGYKQTWTWGSDPVFLLLRTSQSCCKPAWLATYITGAKWQEKKPISLQRAGCSCCEMSWRRQSKQARRVEVVWEGRRKYLLVCAFHSKCQVLSPVNNQIHIGYIF